MTKDDAKKIDYTRKKIARAQAEFEKMKAGQKEEYHWYCATDGDCAYYVAGEIKDGRRRANRALRKIKYYFDECRL